MTFPLDNTEFVDRSSSYPEVLAPAGSLRSVKAAIDYGADAVYCGGKAFGMRSAAKNLSLEDFAQAAQYAHAREAKIYVTCNILPRNDEVAQMNEYFGQLADTGIDALIVTDIGVLMSARQIVPQLEIHVSTQAGVTNYQAANALYQLGAKRVVLARELDLEAIRTIRAHTPADLDIECFVHGSMCMAFSGRCLISSHMTGRDANHGDCAQSCRWKYHVMEEKRPNEFFPVEITDQGTFLFNSQDMNMLPHIDEVIDAGVTSLKIEGRAKSAYYAAAMANAYSCAVKEYMRQRGFTDSEGNHLKPFHDLVCRATEADNHADITAAKIAAAPPVKLPEWLLAEPYKVTHREYSTGFYYPDNQVGENIHTGGYINDWQTVGEVLSYDGAEKRVRIFARNKIVPGSLLEFLIPGRPPITYTVPEEGLKDAFGKAVAAINNPAHEFSLPCPSPIPAGIMIRTQTRSGLKRAQVALGTNPHS